MSAVAVPQRTYDLGQVEQIPLGEGRRFVVGHVPVAVFRQRDGRVFATQAICPHKAGPLADGIIGAGKVVCPLHAYKFDLESGKPLDSECKALRTFPVQVDERGHLVLTFQAREAD